MFILNMNHLAYTIKVNLRELGEAIEDTLKDPKRENLVILERHAFRVAGFLSRVYNDTLDVNAQQTTGTLNILFEQRVISRCLYEGCLDIINFDTDFLDNVDSVKILEGYVACALQEE